MTITEKTIREAVNEDKKKGIDLEEIERSYTAALRYKLITLDEWTIAMDAIWN